MALTCKPFAELLSHATRGNPAFYRITQEPHFPADGGSQTAAHPAKSKGSSC